MEDKKVLEIQDLTVEYITHDEIIHAVTNLSLTIKQNKTIGLVGETGAGKTTTAKAIMRLIPDPPGIIKSGKVVLEGKDIYSLPPKELEKIRGSSAAMIFQDPMTALNPVLTVGDQIEEAIAVHNPNFSTDEKKSRTNEMLEQVGIPKERGIDYPHQFSGGMKQRVVIAIALSCKPSLLIADEPTTALDVTIQAQVLDLIKELQKKYKMSILMITHDLGIVSEICDEVAVMYAGKIVEHGSLIDIFEKTAHPYTEGLFNSLPNIHNRQVRLEPIPGMMPDPANLPSGCPFSPRCAYAIDKCSEFNPPLIKLSDSHSSACIRQSEQGFCLKNKHIN